MNTANQLITAVREIRSRLMDDPDWEVHQVFSWYPDTHEWYVGVVNNRTLEERGYIVSPNGFEDVTDQYDARIKVEDREIVEV